MGPWKQIKTMFDSKRALSTIIYIVAIGAWASGGRGGAVVGGVIVWWVGRYGLGGWVGECGCGAQLSCMVLGPPMGGVGFWCTCAALSLK